MVTAAEFAGRQRSMPFGRLNAAILALAAVAR